MSKVYIYKMTTDNGGAPCIKGRLLSLAICKPAIRSSAEATDTILGFAANSLFSDNKLIYAAKVTRNLDARIYFKERKYLTRADCVYKWDGNTFSWRREAKYHSAKDLGHDLGDPPGYRRARVLLSEGADNFRYFRGDCPVEYKRRYARLKFLVENLGQGHRVNFGRDLHDELRDFMAEIWASVSPHRQSPVARDRCDDTCNSDDDGYAWGEC